MTILAVIKARARTDRLVQAVRELPREMKAEIMRDIDQFAPELRTLMEELDAVPVHFKVRDGNGWRVVISPALVKREVRAQGNGDAA
jgi:hypothetical protein